jgi:RNA polymerase sigma factor (sigma-70 family)
MSLASAEAPARPTALFDDEALVRQCLDGSEEAWGNLIEKYKNLIFSIPVKAGLSQDDATEVFQMVCAELVQQLSNLRKPRALPQWLIKVATHESFRTANRNRRFVEVDPNVEDNAGLNNARRADEILREAERDQLLRNAISALQPRCQKLISMLFFEEPSLSYEQIAQRLGLAEGSIGFIRGRCLERLRKHLQKESL